MTEKKYSGYGYHGGHSGRQVIEGGEKWFMRILEFQLINKTE